MLLAERCLQKTKRALTRSLGWLLAGDKIRRLHVVRAVSGFLEPGAHVLDAGCGRGEYVLYLAKKHPRCTFDGIDINQDSCEACIRRKERLKLENVRFVPRSVTDDCGNGEYDLVYCVDVLEHIADDEIALRSLAKALRSRGRLILHVPCAGCEGIFQGSARFDRRFKELGYHLRDGYLSDQLLAKLTKCGFIVLQDYYTFGKFRGGLAWELSTLLRKPVTLPLAVLAIPLVILLAHLDLRAAGRNKSGRGILVVAAKRPS